MTVARVLAHRATSYRLITANADEKVASVVDRLAEHRIGALPVLDADGTVAGIFSERDVVYGLAREGAALLSRAVGEVMTQPAIAAEPQTQVLEALSLMTHRRIRHLPVIAEGRLAGFVSIGDLVKHRIEHIETEAQALRSYIHSV